MAIVYQHRRKDTNEVFYIGIGNKIKRAYSKHNRNTHWRNIVNSVGYQIDILINGCSYDEAKKVEIGLIKDYGRRDLGLGPLVNMTDGGDGIINPSEEARKKISERISGENHPKYGIPIPESQRQSIIESNKTRVISEETRKKHSERQKGEKHPRYGIPIPESQRQSIIESNKLKKGSVRVNNGLINKMIRPEEIETYYSLGYIKGSVKKLKETIV